ncbi:TPA: hypothetical protein NJ508_004531 [Vibrio parahaemolyticus]|nr:hypothetical protein [Vibrio parahaemolyticus]
MKTCYLCKNEFDGVSVKQHDEHIIQNSIGGKLTASDILCEKCGGCLGKHIDEKFTSSTLCLSVLLDLARDRGESAKSRINVSLNEDSSLNDDNINFEIKSDFSIIPSKPVYTLDDKNKVVTVFGANAKQIKQYRKGKTIQNLINDGYVVNESENIADYVKSAELDINYESPELLRGILKIAIGFAAFKGIPDKYLNPLTKSSKLIECDKSISKIIWQYYPTTDEEKIYETSKNEHEDWYPNHQIYLFNINNNLYCYVEIFGVIQKYVHLSDSYNDKNILEKYLQKTTKWEFKKEDWMPRRLQDWHILAHQFDVPYDLGNFEQMQKKILQRARSRSYDIEPESQIEKVNAIMQNLILYTFSNIKGHDFIDQLHAKAKDAQVKFNFELVNKIKKNPMTVMNLMNKDYSDFRIGNVNNSCPIKSKSYSRVDKDKYVSYKSFELLTNINLENKIEFRVLGE